MLLYKYSEDEKYKKYTLRQSFKKLINIPMILFYIGFFLMLMPHLILSDQEIINIFSNIGLFLFFGFGFIFIDIHLFGGGLSLGLDIFKNNINGKKIIKRGGMISYFNKNEVSVWLEK